MRKPGAIGGKDSAFGGVATADEETIAPVTPHWRKIERIEKRNAVGWLPFAIVWRLVYITYIVEMTSYDDFRKCNKGSTITRLEWVLGSRPADECRP